MKINENIFRAYDIRGIYPSEVNEEFSYTLGQSFGSYALNMGINDVVVGFDNRLSSPSLAGTLINGLLSTGINVTSIGLVTTPMFYFAKIHLKKHAGLMITASHNPKEYNGYKISFTDIGNALGDEIVAFKDFTVKGEFKEGKGELSTYNIKEEYITNMINSLDIKTRKKVVFDCGNGTGSIIIEDILKRLDVEYYLLHCDSDGTFPNHHPDPNVNENVVDISQKVIELGYDLGIGIDADGDRVRVIDDKGNIIDTDTLMAVIYTYLNNNLKVRKAVFDVKCSKSLIDTLDKLNIEKIMWRTGNSYTYRKIKEEALDFGGEFSGHLYFSDKWPNFDDGIYGGLRVLEMISKLEAPFSELTRDIPKYFSSEEIFYEVLEEHKFTLIEKALEYVKTKGYDYIDIDGVRINYPDGWALIRASNTGPKLTIRFEAKSKERLEEIQNEIVSFLNNEKQKLMH